MAYFPFFMELEGRAGLIVGDGRTALGKARKLSAYGPRLLVVAQEVCPELEAISSVIVEKRTFAASDIRENLAFVIAATDDMALNRKVASLCREQRVPVNVVDAPEECTFLFPSLVRRGPLSIGISTGGASPSAAIYVKNEIDRMLPDTMGEILAWLSRARQPILQRVGSEEARKAIFQNLFEQSLRLDRPLTAEETEHIIEAAEE